MTDRGIRVLLIDGQVEDAHWVQELLSELAESRFGGGWRHGIQMFPIDRLADALLMLGDADSVAQIDAVLLNPQLPDSSGLHSLLKIRNLVPDMPVVVLANADDPDLAVSMIRAGAQDFLSKTELDSVPLARSLRLAVERGRIMRDLRATSHYDEATGLLNRPGFVAACGQDIDTARRLGLRVSVVVLDVVGMDQVAKEYGKENAHLAVMETADALRMAIGEQEVPLARIHADRFAYCAVTATAADADLIESSVERRFQRLLQKLNHGRLRVRAGSVCLETTSGRPAEELVALAESALCENMGHLAAAHTANGAGRHV